MSNVYSGKNLDTFYFTTYKSYTNTTDITDQITILNTILI